MRRLLFAAVLALAPAAHAKAKAHAEPAPLSLHSPDGGPPEELLGDSDPALLKLATDLVAAEPLFARADKEDHLSFALVDITDPSHVRYALRRPDWETFTASLSKIAVMLGVFDKLHRTADTRSMATLKPKLDQMIKFSSNEDAKDLFRWAGHDAIRDALYAHKLYDDQRGGLWWTLASRQDKARLSHKEGLALCATARQVARYFLLMEQGRLVTPEDSLAIKSILHDSALALLSQGIKKAYLDIEYYGKPGIYADTVAEGLLVEAPTARYIFAVISKGMDYQDPVFARFGRSLHAAMLARHAAPPHE
jgi:beta-lactamase class A